MKGPVDQDSVYLKAAAEFGPPLARLAAAYEADPARQQDLLQDLHFALWRSLAAFRHQCSLRTWVYRVAHNTATTYVRKQQRSRRIPLASLEELSDLVDPTDVERSANDAVALDRIKALVQRLKPLDRDVPLLYLEGLQAAEIGDIVGMSSANVAQKIHRIQKHLTRAGGVLLALWAAVGLYSVRRFHNLTSDRPESSASTCLAWYQRQLEQQRDVALSRPLGIALGVPGVVLLLIGYVVNGVPWTVSLVLAAAAVFGAVGAIVHGRVLASRWQQEIESLRTLKGEG